MAILPVQVSLPIVYQTTVPGALQKALQKMYGGRILPVFPLLVMLPHEEFDTGYGMPWTEEGRDVFHYVKLAEKTGFVVVELRAEDHHVFLKLQRPQIMPNRLENSHYD